MKYKRAVIIICILLLVFCLSWSKSIDFSQDLGRHLTIGQIIITTKQIPQTNLFSYTNKNFPFVNHHWLTEAIFYLLVSSFGLGSLFILRLALLTGAVLIFFLSTKKNTHPLLTGIASLIFIPLILERIDIRPELFGFFLSSLLVYIIFFQNNKRLHYIIPALMLMWVNVHISFVFGLFLLTVGIISNRSDKRMIFILILGILATLLNPHGLAGTLAPFTIFRNYGYPIVENQNIFFINSMMMRPVLRLYLFLFPIVLCSVAVLVYKKEYSKAIFTSVFYLLGMWQIRHIPFFVFTSVPAIAEAFDYIYTDLIRILPFRRIIHAPFMILFTATSLLLNAFFITGTYSRIYDSKKIFGYGYYEEFKDAADFIMNNNLPKNLFNNFDIGGYAIYRLYPKYRVFVDNRPEAYPAGFLQNTLIRMQEDDALRKKIFQKYGIHTVLFSHTDMTPWGRSFISNILNDPEWRLTYVNTEAFVMTDMKTMPDIRSNTVKLRNIITNSDDPVGLLALSSFLSNLSLGTLAEESVQKARRINPLSCAIRKADYEQIFTNALYRPATDVKPWWCY